jgi:hypothetical protein
MRYIVPIALGVCSLTAQTLTCDITYGETVWGSAQMQYWQASSGARDRPIALIIQGDGWHGNPTTRLPNKYATHMDWLVTVANFNVISLALPGYLDNVSYIWPASAQGTRAALGYIAHWANSASQSPGADSGNSCTLFGNPNDIRAYAQSSGSHSIEWMIGAPKSTYATACTYCDSGYTITSFYAEAFIGRLKTAADFGSQALTAITSLLGCNPDTCTTNASAASWTQNILSMSSQPLPPIYMSFGDQDGQVGRAQALEAFADMRAAGVPVVIRDALKPPGCTPNVTCTGYSHPVDTPTNDTTTGSGVGSLTLPSMQTLSHYQLNANCNDTQPCGPAAASWYFFVGGMTAQPYKGIAHGSGTSGGSGVN